MQKGDASLNSRQRGRAAFTLIELLVVLVIIGLIAAIALPKLQGIGKSNITLSAERQMLDAFAYARQLAVADRSDVYVVFVSPDIRYLDLTTLVNPSTGNPDLVAQRVYTNVLSGQYSTYALLASRRVGDQPGQSHWRYLSPWLSLPKGTFISTNKFMAPNETVDIHNLTFNSGNTNVGKVMTVHGFNVGNFPFPTEQSPRFSLPYVGFNPRGQLASGRDEYVPLAQGSILYTRSSDGQIVRTQAPDVQENPPGNSTNAYLHDVIMIDFLTGRAHAEHTQMQ